SRRPEATIMAKPLFRKRSRFPSVHSCRRNRNPVNSTRGIWDVAADFFKALSPEKLTATSNVVLTFKAVFCRVITTLLCERCSRNAQLRVVREFPDQKLQVIRIK